MSLAAVGLIQQSACLALVAWKPLRSHRGGGGGSKAQSELAGLGQSAWELLHIVCGKGVSISFPPNILTAFYISWLPQATGQKYERRHPQGFKRLMYVCVRARVCMCIRIYVCVMLNRESLFPQWKTNWLCTKWSAKQDVEFIWRSESCVKRWVLRLCEGLCWAFGPVQHRHGPAGLRLRASPRAVLCLCDGLVKGRH